MVANIVREGVERDCTADDNPRSFVVAIERDRLPAVPFTVSPYLDCNWCRTTVVSDLVGVMLPVPTLTESDRWQIFVVAARHRIEVDNSFGGTDVFRDVDVVEVAGIADQSGFIDMTGGRPFTQSEQNSIGGALGSRTVRFVPASAFLDPASTQTGYALLSMADPIVIDGRLAITTNLWCGGECGIGSTNVLVRDSDGVWQVSEPIGPQWIS